MNECIVWKGALWNNGYAEARANGRKIRVHRYVYEWASGEKVPDGKVVMHSCDNRACVNPSHLSVGTQAENMQDMWAKGRGFTPLAGKYPDNCKNGHPWTPESTYIDPDGDRTCRTCKLDRQRTRRALYGRYA